jgi:hypothetical protein
LRQIRSLLNVDQNVHDRIMERTIVLRVLTRCATIEQFVDTFRRLSTDTAVFVPTRNQREVGVETAFSMRLVDGTIVLSGLGAIAARYETADNAFGKPGILVDIRRLTSESEPVFERMRAAQAPPIVRDGALCDCDDELAIPAALPDESNTTRTPQGDARLAVATTLGVAPLAPATFVTSPFVIDTPIPRWPRGSLPEQAMVATTEPLFPAEVPQRPERTAMVALDRESGEPRPGPWLALCARLARTVRTVRWWMRRRRSTQQIRT